MVPQSGLVIEVCTKIPLGLIPVRGLKIAVIATREGGHASSRPRNYALGNAAEKGAVVKGGDDSPLAGVEHRLKT
jgi:hypothetical protein